MSELGVLDHSNLDSEVNDDLLRQLRCNLAQFSNLSSIDKDTNQVGYYPRSVNLHIAVPPVQIDLSSYTVHESTIDRVLLRTPCSHELGLNNTQQRGTIPADWHFDISFWAVSTNEKSYLIFSFTLDYSRQRTTGHITVESSSGRDPKRKHQHSYRLD
jgi:hypothetical protein